VVVSHDPRWREFADRTITLCDGQVEQEERIYDRPQQMGHWRLAHFPGVVVTGAFLGNTRSRNSGASSWDTFDSATATVAFASPGRVEGASETTQLGAAGDGDPKAVYVKEDQFVKREPCLADRGCDDLQASLQLR